MDFVYSHDTDYVTKLSILFNQGLLYLITEPFILSRDNNINILNPKILFIQTIINMCLHFNKKDTYDVVEFIKHGYSLEEAFVGCLNFQPRFYMSLAMDLHNLRRFFMSSAARNSLPDWSDFPILKQAAEDIDLEKIQTISTLPVTPLNSLYSLAKFRSLVDWNNSPEMLYDETFFLNHIMAALPGAYFELKELYGLTDDSFRNALLNAPPGVFRYESPWLYWNQRLNFDPILPFPRKYPPSL
jgi:hypothetical protein